MSFTPQAPPTGFGDSGMGMSYGDLLAPPPSYADSVMYSKPHGGEMQDEAFAGGGAGGRSSFGGDAGTHTTITLAQALNGSAPTGDQTLNPKP